MNFTLTDMTVSRTKVKEDHSDNSLLGSCTIIQPVSFELEVTRNMEGAFKEFDIPEIKVEGLLATYLFCLKPSNLIHKSYNAQVGEVFTLQY